MKTIYLMMDSLNRHYLSVYGKSWLRTPNIDRLAERGVVFENHYSGSLPCMPARREMMTGRLNFLEAPWGPIEPWDDCLPQLLRDRKGTYSHMVTDHYHYFHSGGEAYHTLFDSWEFERGQEGDVWRPLVNAPAPPPGSRGKGALRKPYWANRAFMDPESDESYSTPRCFMRAIEFLDTNHSADNWHLHLEVFDPHEPFDCPKKYRDLYEDTWNGPFYTWPSYAKLDPEFDTPEAVDHIRKCYAGTLAMADYWLGKLLDRMDELDLWKDTCIVFSTDHGHLLGEHGYWAKNYMFDYQELAHIPLIVCTPETAFQKKRVASLTATIDIMPTLMELHGETPPAHVHGRSFLHLLEKDEGHHDAVLFGYFGKNVNMVDGEHSYCRQPIPGSTVYHYTAMPRGFADFVPREQLAAAEAGVFLRHSDGIPHFRITRDSTRHMDAPEFNPIYDIRQDPFQTTPIRDPATELRLEDKLVELLTRYDAPECQYARLGLTGRGREPG